MKRRTLAGLFATLALAFAALPAPATPLSANQTLQLSTGREARILSVSKIEYAKGVMALLVRYQTSLSIDEAKAVSSEVDEVWKVAQKDVEHAGLVDAIISSNQTMRGLLLTTHREAKFLFEKGADGHWTRLSRADMLATQ